MEKEYKSALSPKVCVKCGHEVCPHCGDWCDVILYSSSDKGNAILEPGDEYPVMCCDGVCIYE